MAALLFDLDGTLVDTERYKAAALVEACRSFGANPQTAAYSSVMGHGWNEVRSYILREANLIVAAETFDAAFRAAYRILLESKPLAATPGTADVLKACADSRIKVALVTSAPRWQVDLVLARISLKSESFASIITAEDVATHKPSPECYLKTLSILGVDGASALIAEDTEAGVSAGIQAGCRVYAVRHEWNKPHNFSAAIAVGLDLRGLLSFL